MADYGIALQYLPCNSRSSSSSSSQRFKIINTLIFLVNYAAAVMQNM